MTQTQNDECHGIIHTAAAAAATVGGGLAQVPLADHAVITPIQLAMVISLGKVFNRQISESSATAAIGSAAATTIGRMASQVLLGWIPGVGNVINATTAAAITESMGWIIANQFDEGEL